MNELPYSKELSLNCCYDDAYSHILDVADKIKNYTLISESKVANRIIIKDTGINIEINLQRASDDTTNLKMMTCSDKGRYYSSEPTVMKMISRFESALIASIDGNLDDHIPKSDGVDAQGCSGVIALIVAIVLIIIGIIAFLGT